MCGIAGIHLKDRHIDNPNIPLNALVDGLLMNIVKRGHHATGLCAVTKEGKVTVWKKDVEAKDFVAMREWLPEQTKTVLLHTRYFTKGTPAKNENNHPVIYKNCVAVHNGSIDNDDDLFQQYQMHRPAEVDSIAIPMMVHRCGWEKAEDAFGELRGQMATAIIDSEHPGELWLARSYNSPLVYFMDNRFFMFASLKDYIRDAWKNNYGSPPEYKKIKDLGMFETLFIKDDELVVGKFRDSRPAPARSQGPVVRGRPSEHSEVVRRQINTAYDRQAYWWDYDDEGCYDPGSSAARIREGKGDRGLEGVPPVVETINCIECGNSHTKMNIKWMEDATLMDKVVYVWEIPVCVKCIKDMNLTDFCDSFTYSHLGNRSLKYKVYAQADFDADQLSKFEMGEPWEPATDDEDECDRCSYFPVSAVGRNGLFLCRSCLLDQFMQEAKVQDERKKRREEQIKIIKPGDPIPEGLRPHMGVCDSCYNHSCTHISKEGLAVCDRCFAVDGLGENENHYGWCQGCDTRYSKKHLQHTFWGVLCDLCLRGEEGTQQTLTADMREEKMREAIHTRACKEAGADLDYSAGFLNWIIADCTLQQLQEMDMMDTYELCKDAYDDASFVVEWLINEGRTADLNVSPIHPTVWTEALSNKED